MSLRNFNIISPTRGEAYTVEDGIRKLLERRNYALTFDLEGVRLVECYQWNAGTVGDGDYAIPFTANTLPSQWTDSADFSLSGLLFLHSSGAGKWSVGRASEATPDQRPDYRIKKEVGDGFLDITCSLAGEEDEMEFEPQLLSPDGQKWLRELMIELPAQMLGQVIQIPFDSVESNNFYTKEL